MKVSFRQGVVSHQTGGFLQISGSVVNLLATNRPVTVTIAHKDTNYTHSEDASIDHPWFGPFTETNYWLYWDFNPLTFARTFGHTTIEPVAQSIEPGSGNSTIISTIPGDPGIGGFIVDGYFDLAVGRPFYVVNSTSNNGNYTVKSISYNTSNGETTIYVNEAVASSVSNGEATLDIDSLGQPLYIEGRHWFNTTTNTHYILRENNWRQVLRVFAARLLNGNTFISLSQNAQTGDFTGTQIGNNVGTFTGRILFDESSNPIRRDSGTFFTTEDQFFANQTRVDSLRLESNVTRAQCAASSLAEFSVVAWTGDGLVSSANYTDVGSTVVGLLTEDLTYLETGAVIVQGTVTNPSWNWTGGSPSIPVGTSLWVTNGMLVAIDPHVSDPVSYPIAHVPVARILDKDTIIFEQGLGGIGDRGPAGTATTTTPADTTNIGSVTLLTPSSDADRAFVISDTDSRLTDARTPLSHNHSASEVTFQPAAGIISNNTQDAIAELGTTKLSLSGGTMSGLLTLSSDPTIDTHAATKRYVDNATVGAGLWTQITDDIYYDTGNVGIGTTSILNWQTPLKTLQLGNNNSVFSTLDVGTQQIGMVANAYNDGAWKYSSDDTATRLAQHDDKLTFSTAILGSADAAVTWNTSFNLDNQLNMYLGSMDRATGSQGVFHITNATVNPAANPVNGGVLYVQTGALKYRGTSGAATTIINADGSFGSVSSPWTTTGNDLYYDTGNVGIHDSTPAVRLVVRDEGVGNPTVARIVQDDQNVNGLLITNDTYDTGYSGLGLKVLNSGSAEIVTPNLVANTLAFKLGSGSAQSFIIKDDGVIGVGFNTPENWHGSFAVLEVGGNSGIFSHETEQTNAAFNILENAYFAAGSQYIYKTTDVATHYQMNAGQHRFFVAPSGTAGTNITFTRGLTVDVDANTILGVSDIQNNTSTGYTFLQVGSQSAIWSDDTEGAGRQLNVGLNVYDDGTEKYISTDEATMIEMQNGQMIFKVAPSGTLDTAITWTDAVTIDNSGNVELGTAALATTATDGFLYIPSCAGIPTGTPTIKTGRVPLIFDTTNNNLYVYDGSWIGVALT